MQWNKIKRVGILAVAALASLQAASMAADAPTIYFTPGASPPALSQLIDSGSPTNSANHGQFSPSDTADSILSVTPSGGVYIPAFVDDINSSGTGDPSDYVKIGGFLSPPGNIFVALKLDNNGAPGPNSSVLNAIDTAINANYSSTFVTASLVSTSPVAGVFPGYDIVLAFPSTFTNTTLPVGSPPNGQYDFGFDFSTYTDSTVTVTDIGVVPEPGCLGLLSAAGLLLLPRYRRQRA